MQDLSVRQAHHITIKAEAFIQALVWLTHRHQYHASTSAINAIVKTNMESRIQAHLASWPSIFSGHTWIINRSTPAHKDVKGFKSGYDYLSASGSALAELKLPDAGITCSYNPGTVVALAGRVMNHEVNQLSEGNRISVARWIRTAILTRFGSGKGNPDFAWSTIKDLENNVPFLLTPL
jgi:hypothetical protein